jgi:hypothetical protein
LPEKKGTLGGQVLAHCRRTLELKYNSKLAQDSKDVKDAWKKPRRTSSAAA